MAGATKAEVWDLVEAKPVTPPLATADSTRTRPLEPSRRLPDLLVEARASAAHRLEDLRLGPLSAEDVKRTWEGLDGLRERAGPETHEAAF